MFTVILLNNEMWLKNISTLSRKASTKCHLDATIENDVTDFFNANASRELQRVRKEGGKRKRDWGLGEACR